MSVRKQWFVFLVLTALLCLMVAPLYAQDEVTPAPEGSGADTLVVGGDGADTLVVPLPEDGGDVIVTPSEPAPVSTSALLNLVAAIIMSIAGGGSILMIFDRILKSREVLDNTERAYESLSPTWQDTIRLMVETTQKAAALLERALNFADKATDKLPNDEPPSLDADTQTFPPVRYPKRE